MDTREKIRKYFGVSIIESITKINCFFIVCHFQINVSPKIGENDRKARAFSITDSALTNTSSTTSDLSNSEEKEIRLVTMIGKGRFFTVWDGEWNRTRRVAIKKITEQFSLTANAGDEIAKMKSLHHPNLVQLYAANTSKQPTCLIMELMERGSLLDYLRGEGRLLQFHQLIQKAEEIASGMSYLEQQNYIHQNLSARNVMLSKDLVCKVSNYGIVRLIKQVNDDNSIPLFFPKRTAPEAFLNSEFSIKSDVWSFGILLYELVTYGQLPYLEISNDQIMKQLQEGYRMPCPENCEEKLHEIMLACWRKEPENRPTFETLKWQMEDYFSTDDEGYIYMRRKKMSIF